MYGGYAHGCAVNGKTMTARHVVDHRVAYGDLLRVLKFRYDFFDGGVAGIGRSVTVRASTDLATVSLDKEPPFGYAKVGSKPERGDRIRWVEYDAREDKKAFRPRARSGEVVSTFAGTIILKLDATQGASGGCAYNDANEVVGLMAFVGETDDDKSVTGVIGFYDEWWQ